MVCTIPTAKQFSPAFNSSSVNDPEKLERLATSGKYTNGVLQSIQEHHRNNERLLTAFFSADMNDDERWELIEQYFLGNEEYVRRILHIAD